VSRAAGSLWRAIQVDPSYYVFWLAIIAGLGATALMIWWELRGIRRALEGLAALLARR
jgi:hypothetical protein